MNKTKKFYRTIFAVIITLSLPICLHITPSAIAASEEVLFEGRTNCANGPLGLTPWDCQVKITNSQDSLKKEIWKIAANVATDITIIASYLALGYVIYGGYQYTLSGDEPSKAAAGKKTLARAFIGLAISLSSSAIMGTIRSVLVGNGNLLNCVTEICVGPNELLMSTLNWFLMMIGIVATVFIVYGGISYSTSAGSPEKIKKSKTMITNALIGLAIVILAEMITGFVSSIIRNANDNPASSEENGYLDTTREEKNFVASLSIQASTNTPSSVNHQLLTKDNYAQKNH